MFITITKLVLLEIDMGGYDDLWRELIMVYSYISQEPWLKPSCFLNMWNLVISTIRLNYNWIQSNVCHMVCFLGRNVLFGPCVRSATVTCAHELCRHFETEMMVPDYFWHFLNLHIIYGKESQQKNLYHFMVCTIFNFLKLDVASVQNPKWATTPLTTKFPHF